MEEISYRRKLGFALGALFLADLVAVIVYTVLPYVASASSMDYLMSVKMNLSVGIVINLMSTIIFGYIVVRPGVCSSTMARVSAALMLLVVVFNLLMKVYMVLGGSYWFENVRWYDIMVSLVCFLLMTVFLFKERIWLVTKILGTFTFFMSVVLDFIYYCVVQEYVEYGKNYFDTYSSIVIVFDVAWFILYLVCALLMIFWAIRKPR